MSLPADNRCAVSSRHPAAPTSTDELNELVPGYHFVEHLESGGMGAVYKAVQKSLNRTVAVKVLSKLQSDRQGFKERFKREAQALAQLNHPHIVDVHDFGETRDGQLYYIMEFVVGTDLFHLARVAPPSPRKLLQIFLQVCEALQYAHDHGVVHRDIKPANILLDERGNAKVADFGLAKILEPNAPDFTATGTTIGTPDYIAPEAMDPTFKIDHRVDVYALGVTLYEMLTGHPPRGRWEAPSTCCGADKRLDGIVGRALHPDPARRYQRVADMAQALQGLLKSGGDWKSYRRPATRADVPRSTARAAPVDSKVATQEVAVPAPGMRAKNQWPRVAWGLAAALAVFGVVFWLSGRQVQPPAETTVADVPTGTSHAQQDLLRWVFARHGLVNVFTDSKPGKAKADLVDIDEMKDLPKEPFVIWRVCFGAGQATIRDEKSLKELARLSNELGTVSNVALRAVDVPVSALRHLALIESMTSVDLSDSPVITLEAVPYLAACKNLRLLRLGWTGRPMDRAIVDSIRARLPNCKIMENK